MASHAPLAPEAAKSKKTHNETPRHFVINGQVQGVGFRPAIWNLAQQYALDGLIYNSAKGVEMTLWGEDCGAFIRALPDNLPPLAKISSLSEAPTPENAERPNGFVIAPSTGGDMHSAITPDAATCPACRDEIFDPFAPRYRYPFTSCTHCGPRFSILHNAPYDRAQTSMAEFEKCPMCDAEYSDPADRRFHAQPIACHICGPKAWIEKLGGGTVNSESFSMLDDVDAVAGMLINGHIVAIKGLGGVHLACDASNDEAVRQLRARKNRPDKAFALMAGNVDIIRQYAHISDEETAILASAEAPIVLLKKRQDNGLANDQYAKVRTVTHDTPFPKIKHDDLRPLSPAIAPGLSHLGFMLPYTPLHHLLFKRVKRPLVMTSGNISGEAQYLDNGDIREHLAGIADFACLHNRDIVHRVDDSLVRVDANKTTIIRRARGYAPAPLSLPKGFEHCPPITAFGGDLKNTFCLARQGEAILSQHMGDLADASVMADMRSNFALYHDLYSHRPAALASDKHPEYHSHKMALAMAEEQKIPLISVQHHHAHIAAVMAENGMALDHAPILGIALDGTGWGDDGTIWGGEFLACDYFGYQRLAHFKPVALPGGDMAARQPWRNLWAHIEAEMGWAEFAFNFSDLPLFAYLADKPRDTLSAMVEKQVNSPLSSSCGRLFDAVAAACGLALEAQSYEGHAAMLLESIVDEGIWGDDPMDMDILAYPFAIPNHPVSTLPYIEPLPMWRAILGDLIEETAVSVIAARFHLGLARALAAMVVNLNNRREDSAKFQHIALGGGCFQNRILSDLLSRILKKQGFTILCARQIPANDGGLALGQAAIATAHLINKDKGE